MSSSPVEPAAGRSRRRVPILGVPLRASCSFAAVLAAMHAAAAWVALSAPWPPACGLASALILLLHAAWGIRRHALLRASASITGLRLHGEDECELQPLAGERIRGRIDGSSFVLPWMIVLRVAVRGRYRLHSVVLLPDAMRADDFRRLRARLRWSRLDRSTRFIPDAWL